MALPEICSMAEVVSYLGKGTTLSNSELGQLTLIKGMAESVVRQYCEYGITQQTYTHFLPENDSLATRDTQRNLGYGGSTLSFPNLYYSGPVLQLPEAPVISVTSVHEQRGARADRSTANFDSTNLLTEGEDYYLDTLQASFSPTAHIIRVDTSWPSEARSVKVVYVAGWTKAQLRGDVTDWRLDASDIRLATIKTVVEAYNEMVNQQSGQGGTGGPIKSERLGDYSVSYDTMHVGPKVEIPEDAKIMLNRFRRADNMVF